MRLIIENYDISDVTAALKITESCLAESEAITLGGSRRVDRTGGFHTAIEITIGRIALTRWEQLEELLKKLPVKVQTLSRGVLKTYSMSVVGELPSPYLYTDAKGDWYASITFTMKEVGP